MNGKIFNNLLRIIYIKYSLFIYYFIHPAFIFVFIEFFFFVFYILDSLDIQLKAKGLKLIH